MATAELRLGIPKKVVILSLDTPGRLGNFGLGKEFGVFFF